MIRTMITATNTMSQLQNQLDTIGNNLANSSTHGFKSTQVSFQELLYQQYNNDKRDTAPRQTPEGIRYGVGAKVAQTQMNWKQGAMLQTDRPLDFTLTTPKQYFNVIMPGADGEQAAFTRQGSFYVTPIEDNQHMLVTSEGYPVANEDGLPIIFDDQVKGYAIRPDGVLEIQNNDGTVNLSNMGVTVIDRPDLMEHISGTYMGLPANMAELGVPAQQVARNLQGQDRGVIGLVNGFLEGSNVNYEKEMTDLISTQRSYQFNSRAVSIADQMLGLVNGIR